MHNLPEIFGLVKSTGPDNAIMPTQNDSFLQLAAEKKNIIFGGHFKQILSLLVRAALVSEKKNYMCSLLFTNSDVYKDFLSQYRSTSHKANRLSIGKSLFFCCSWLSFIAKVQPKYKLR